MILFETTTSVFELLWDIAVALFIIRISFIYFSLSFISGLFIVYLRLARLQPINHFSQPQAELITLPLWLLSIILWARLVVVVYEVPRVNGFRVAIGLVALIFMVTSEVVGGWVMYKEGWRDWIWETDPLAAGLGAVVFLLFGLMPLLVTNFEGKSELAETSHGHEKKTVIAAVPTISKTEKTGQDAKKNN